ncbi:putative sodium/solute symporter [Medicago truncatula]|uniref:Urea-proton symporter DUR3 n=1 Tax=Medicago truncatula TaxID=3880 RepID=G7K6S1_MEDTR|nr:urea-proton symporter DUR3 [Medicago truncatula]AES95541.1 sodium:solute symporter family protein [Medicago truncatula]RHN54645.1 putative sodium/solute symporter [Medicago truncatula]
MASSSQCPPFEFSSKYYHENGGGCVRQASFFEGKPVLNQGVGYSIILGFGAFFALFTSFLVWLEKRYVGSRHTSEWFNTAGRNVKTGLIASVIVSQWTWAATILQSSNVAWEYGVSGPFWYASGATIQVMLFGIMAIEIKRKAPYAHTVCEIVKARWGTSAHIVFLFFCFMTNIIVTAMLLLGGSAVVNALTGVNIYAASFLIPLGVIVYTLAGGLKATFLASYIHSVIVHVVLVIFVYLVYTSSSELGSPSVVYNRLLEVASKTRTCQDPISHHGQSCGPVSGNHKGSYLTMLSSGGLVFGIINIVGNFGTVFVDNGYWVSAIAARPSSTHKGYLLGGLVWFAVPFSLATSLGLGALALDLPLNESEAGRGLVPPATAVALMGKGGSILLLTMLFMAVTSAGSSELIAVSSLCTYDIYRTYINPNASGKKILRVSRMVVLGFGCFMGLLAVILNKAGVSLGWMYLAMGVLIGSAVIPIAFMLLWRKANAIGAILGTVFGCVLGIITWLSVTKIEYGKINLDTSGRNAPMLAGNLVSILTGGVVHAVCSMLWPQNYDWSTTKQITVVEKEKTDLPAEEFKEEKLTRAKVWIVKWGIGFTVLIVILWPILSLPAGEFSKGYFFFWAVIAIGWGTIGSAVIIALPIIESWDTIQTVILGMFTNDRLVEKVDELNFKLHTIIQAIPEAERLYLLEKEKTKKLEASEQQSVSIPM